MMAEVVRSEEIAELLGTTRPILDVKGNRDGFRQEWFENDSQVSCLAIH